MDPTECRSPRVLLRTVPPYFSEGVPQCCMYDIRMQSVKRWGHPDPSIHFYSNPTKGPLSVNFLRGKFRWYLASQVPASLSNSCQVVATPWSHGRNKCSQY